MKIFFVCVLIVFAGWLIGEVIEAYFVIRQYRQAKKFQAHVRDLEYRFQGKYRAR